MPLPTSWNKKKKRPPPPGFDYVEPTLEALEHELRDIVKDTKLNQRKLESMWPIHQINWQKTRYIYDLYYQHHKINKAVYQYCLDQKLIDGDLIAKWKKSGYEKLCSTYVINPAHYKFGTVSICRVPWKDRNSDQFNAKDPTTGCLGCASGPGQPRNIFGNKYGQHLAAIQLAREQRQLEKQQRQARLQQQANDDDDDDAETEDEVDDRDKVEDEEDNDDYGPSPAAGIWAGSRKLQAESEKWENDDAETDDDPDETGPKPSTNGDDGGEAETDDEQDHDDGGEPSSKRRRGSGHD